MRARGFTLLELLVAISIFALIGIASYRVLTGVMQTDERLAVRQQHMRSVNRALWILQQDIEQLVQRNVRAVDGAIIDQAELFTRRQRRSAAAAVHARRPQQSARLAAQFNAAGGVLRRSSP